MVEGAARSPAARRCLLLLGLALSAGVGIGQEVIDSVDVGGWNVAGLTYNSRAGVVYGRTLYAGSFFALDCSTNQIVSRIPLWAPNSVAFSVTSEKAYCTFYAGQGEDSVLVVDGNTHSRLRAIPMPGATWPIWDSVSNRLYVNCYVENQVAVLDCRTDSVITYIELRGEPVGQTINPRHRKLYVHCDSDASLAVIDLETSQVRCYVYPGSLWYASCYSEVADKYYCDGAQGVAVIDGATDSVIKQIRLPQGYGPAAMVSVESESLVMVSTNSGGSDSVFVVDVANDSVVNVLHVGRQPSALAYSPRSRLVYCTSAIWDDLSVIAADGSRVLSHVRVGDGPQCLAVCLDFEKLYVGCGRQWVYVVRDRVGISEANLPGLTPTALPAATVTDGRAFRYEGPAPARLVDACGRKALDVAIGDNDLSSLSQGVYVLLAGRNAAPRRVVKVK